MKKFFRIGCLGVIALIVIGIVISMASGDDGNDTANDSPNSNETKENKKTFKIGDVVKVGDMQYTVNSVEQATKVGSQYVNTEANGVFLILDLTVKNVGNESATVTSSFFKLKEGEKTFEADSSAMIYANQEGNSSLFLDNLNPDVEMSGKVVFDVSQETADSENLILQAQTGYFGTETVEIHLAK